MGIEYRRGHRKVTSKQFFDGIKEDIIKGAENEIELRLKRLRDPATGQPVRITKKRINGEATWSIEGSPEAIEAAKRIIGGT